MTGILSIYESTLITTNIKVIDSSYYALSPLIIVSENLVNHTMVVRNDLTNIEPCFIFKLKYRWEFSYNNLSIKDDGGKIVKEYNIWFMNPPYNTNDFFLTDKTGRRVPGTWHADYTSFGTLQTRKIKITVPEIWMDIHGSQRSYARAINQKIFLELSR